MTGDGVGAGQREPRRRSGGRTALLFSYDFRPWEWLTIGVVAMTIVIVNKLVIQDRGSSWAGLILLSFNAGLALIHATRWARRRS